MADLSFDYWNKLAGQLVVISSLLDGFSLSAIIPLIEARADSKPMNYIFRSVVIATASFLISIFAMTKIMMMTSQGFPTKVTGSDLLIPRLVGALSFLVGILSIVVVISLSGWQKSGSMKRFTLFVGLLTLLILALLL